MKGKKSSGKVKGVKVKNPWTPDRLRDMMVALNAAIRVCEGLKKASKNKKGHPYCKDDYTLSMYSWERVMVVAAIPKLMKLQDLFQSIVTAMEKDDDV